MNLLQEPWPWLHRRTSDWIDGAVAAADRRQTVRHFVEPASLVCGDDTERDPALRYDWKREGGWICCSRSHRIGGFVARACCCQTDMRSRSRVRPSHDLRALGFMISGARSRNNSWDGRRSASWRGWLTLGVGGFLVGFGARWAGGMYSGPAISGLATFQLPSLIAVRGFFAGGLLMTYVVMPFLF